MKENRVVNYSIIFIALVLLAIVLKTFQAVLRPLAIAAFRIFSQFIVKFLLDNKAVERYLNLSRFYGNENCRWVSGPTTYWDSTGYSTQP